MSGALLYANPARSVKEKTGVLDVRAIACYNFTYQHKGEMYGRETEDVHAMWYARGRDQLNLPHVCGEA